MKFSIIIPAYNCEKTIGRCISSVLQSKFREQHELIVVDDASSDSTAKIAEKLGVRVIRKKKRDGPSKTRNIGTKYAEGEFFVFIDSDVFVFPTTLQRIHDCFDADKELMALSCSLDPKCEMVDIIGRYKHIYMCYIIMNQKRSVSWAYACTFAVRKEAFTRIGGFNEDIKVNEDAHIGRELSHKGYKIAFKKSVPVRHYRTYGPIDFIKEEFRRSKTLAVMRLSGLFNGKHMQKHSAGNLLSSILIMPFFVVFGLINYNSPIMLLFAISLLMILLLIINRSFLRFCHNIFGPKMMIKAFFLIPLDSLICGFGIGYGIISFIGGKRI